MTTPMKTDTAPAAARAQAEALRRLSPARRLELAVEMSQTARSLLVARLRAEHPDWSQAGIRDQCLRVTFPGTILPPLDE